MASALFILDQTLRMWYVLSDVKVLLNMGAVQETDLIHQNIMIWGFASKEHQV